MELGFILLSDHSESVNGKIYTLGAGWNQLRFPELPQEFNFSISLGLDVPWDETNLQHTMTLHIEDPDGERLGDEFSLDFETGRPPGSVAGQEQRIVLSLGARHGLQHHRPARGGRQGRRRGDRPDPLLRDADPARGDAGPDGSRGLNLRGDRVAA